MSIRPGHIYIRVDGSTKWNNTSLTIECVDPQEMAQIRGYHCNKIKEAMDDMSLHPAHTSEYATAFWDFTYHSKRMLLWGPYCYRLIVPVMP